MSVVVGVEGQVYWHDRVTGQFRRGGVTPLGSRADLVKGTDRPVRDVNTGVLLGVQRTDLSPANQGQYVMSAGEVLRDRTIHGRLKLASNVLVENVRVMGTPPNPTPGINDHLPLVEVPSSTTGAVVRDSTLVPKPEYESPQVYGSKGAGGVRYERCVFARCVDTAQVWGSKEQRFVQCWMGDPFLVSPDPTRSDGDATHNDNPQAQGGGGTVIIDGCTLDMWISNFETWFSTAIDPSMFNLLVTADVGTPPAIVRVLDSWLRGGSYPINVATPPSSECTITGNRIELGQMLEGGQFWHLIAPTSVQNMWTLTGNVNATVTDGVWTTDATAIRVKQG